MITRTLAPAILAVALAFTGCAKKEAPLTEDQKAVIRQEVLQAMKPLWTACEKMDPAIMTKYCLDGPDFAFAMPDGKVHTFAEFSKLWAEMIPQIPAQKLVIRSEKVIVLAPDAVLYCWQGGNDMIQKDGAVLRADPMAGTYLLRKVDGAWKGTYLHESSLPMAPVKPTEPEPVKK
jgi:hypothetical protein